MINKFKYECVCCKKTFLTNKKNKKFCNDVCKRKFYYKKREKPLIEYICKNCKDTYFTQKNPFTKFCPKCRNERKQQGSFFKKRGIATGTVGAIGELLVSSDLMTKGYEVYRALSQSSSCDILAIKDNKILKVEVRTGTITLNGKMSYPLSNIKGDQIAVIVHQHNDNSNNNDYKIHYFPEILV